jgi:hypothetical protein
MTLVILQGEPADKDNYREFWLCDEEDDVLVTLLDRLQTRCKDEWHDTSETLNDIAAYALAKAFVSDGTAAGSLWYNVFGAMPLGSGTPWTQLEFLDSADWDTPGYAVLSIENPEEDGEITKQVAVFDLALAVATFMLKGQTCYGNTFTFDAGWPAWDCVSADMVLQQIVLGSVVYG